MFDEKELKQFDRWNKPRPTHEPHGTDEAIRENMKQLLPKSWYLQGNKLIGMTEVGELVQTIPTNYICLGSDEAGLPILKKINVKG